MQEQQAPQYDTLYQTFDKGLYKKTGDEETNSIMAMIQGNSGANNVNMLNVPSDVIGSGQGTSATSMAVGGVMSGKVDYSDTTEGYFLGVDADSIAKLNVGNDISFLKWDGTSVSLFLGMGGSFTIDTGDALTGSSIALTNEGISFIYNGLRNTFIYLSLGSNPYTVSSIDVNTGPLASGGITFRFLNSSSNTGEFSPAGLYTINLGNSLQFFNEINYKTLTDRGCLGWFDEGVELQDGSKVSDTAAIKSIQKNTNKNTVYGVPMLDYSTMPKAVFKPAPIATEDVHDAAGNVICKKGEKMGQDGAETTALISIMFGAIKELIGRVEVLETAAKSTGLNTA